MARSPIIKRHLRAEKPGESTLCSQKNVRGYKMAAIVIPLDEFISIDPRLRCRKCLKIHESRAKK